MRSEVQVLSPRCTFPNEFSSVPGLVPGNWGNSGKVGPAILSGAPGLVRDDDPSDPHTTPPAQASPQTSPHPLPPGSPYASCREPPQNAETTAPVTDRTTGQCSPNPDRQTPALPDDPTPPKQSPPPHPHPPWCSRNCSSRRTSTANPYPC